MKSFLAGNPELRLALNEDLIIGKQIYQILILSNFVILMIVS